MEAPKAAETASAPADQAPEVKENTDIHGADTPTPVATGAVTATAAIEPVSVHSSNNADPESANDSSTADAVTRRPRKSKSDNDFGFGRISVVSSKDVNKMRESSCQTDPITIAGEKSNEAAPSTAAVGTASAAARAVSPTPRRSHQNDDRTTSKGSSTLIGHDDNKDNNNTADVEKGTAVPAVSNQEDPSKKPPPGPQGDHPGWTRTKRSATSSPRR
ncbi:hypothetical protein PG996_009830 [Apiospora saccharicola]|uniref:Uncharacterized protein n=1 Tax=Apiospora saccharicola TaxID=335842 RepID=A0ABR1UPA6_9PEZI